MSAAKANLPLFTVGHSTHEAEVFLNLLKTHGIQLIADVRSSPYSRMAPQFDREAMIALLRRSGIRYQFMGPELGARRSEPECYASGKARYDLIAKAPLFHTGLQSVRQSAAKEKLALLCAEKDPITCHRAILVCRHLRRDALAIQHILSDGSLETHAQSENRMLEALDLSGGHLFESHEQLIERAYDLQGDKIAYVREPAQPATDIR